MLKRFLPWWVLDMRRQAERMRTSFAPHAVVLLYHRIADRRADPFGLAVTPQHFAEQLDVLARMGDCLPVSRLPDGLAGSRRPMFVITFDDGYRDNAEVAAPLLAARDLPATLFVISGIVGERRDFWWDALARAILETPDLPPHLAMKLGAFACHHDLGTAASCSPADLQNLRGWRVEDRPPAHPREALYLALWEAIDAAPASDREAICATILDWAGISREVARTDRPVDAEDVAALAKDGLVEIGGHTVSHLPLDTLDADAARAEIEGCRSRLSEIAGRAVTSFSYPFGRYHRETPEIVRASGFEQACNSHRAVAFASADRFQIPRCVVADVNGEAFAAMLHSLVRS